MKSRPGASTIVLLASLILFSTSGCTLIGRIIGAANPPLEFMTSDEAPFVAGTAVEVTFPDGASMKGQFLDINLVRDERCAALYRAAGPSLGQDYQLPAFHADLTVWHYPDSLTQQISFRGYGGYGRDLLLGVHRDNGLSYATSLVDVWHTSDSEGNVVGRSDYLELAARRQLPKCTLITVDTEGELMSLRADEIFSITRRNPGKGIRKGMLKGLILDAAIVGIAAIWAAGETTAFMESF